MHMSSQAQVTQNPSMGFAGEHELLPITEVISSKLGDHRIGREVNLSRDEDEG